MQACKRCGKKFKTSNALGGHVSSAHAQAGNGVAPQDDDPLDEAAPQEENTQHDGPGQRESIRGLLVKGFSPKQVKEFGYARQTVDDVAAEYLPPDNPPSNHNNDQLPMTRKYGQGVEVMNPEVVMARILNNGQIPPAYGQGLKDGMLLLRAAQLMVMDLVNIRKGEAEAQAKAMEPLLKVMREGREEMDAAARRAKDSNLDVAREAAQESLGRAMPYIDERLGSLEESLKRSEPNPMAGLMARTMEGVMKQLMGSFGMGGQQQGGGEAQMPGVTWNRREAE